MENYKTKQTENKIYTRIAWYDREINKYHFGEWHNMSKYQNYKSLSQWVSHQNKKCPRVKYWLEATDKIQNKAKNAEVYQFIPIVKAELNTTEWIAI